MLDKDGVEGIVGLVGLPVDTGLISMSLGTSLYVSSEGIEVLLFSLSFVEDAVSCCAVTRLSDGIVSKRGGNNIMAHITAATVIMAAITHLQTVLSLVNSAFLSSSTDWYLMNGRCAVHLSITLRYFLASGNRSIIRPMA